MALSTRAPSRNYYRKFGRYPLSLDELKDSNHMRFLRKRYKDPITGSDFRLLHVGEVQLTFRPIARPEWLLARPVPRTGQGRRRAIKNDSTSPSPLVSPSQMGATGGEFGGGPIMGVASTSEKQSFHVFNDGDHYKDWLFVYSPVLE